MVREEESRTARGATISVREWWHRAKGQAPYRFVESSKGNTDTSDVKPTHTPPGYVKQQHDGKAENAGDQSRIETKGKEPRGGVVAKEVPAK